MPRVVRKVSPIGIYHIMVRGVNRQIIFRRPRDKFKFLQTLSHYKEQCGFNIFSYCLMDNHVHLLIKENREPISKCMHRINTSYAIWFNQTYDRYGSLFQGRYRSEAVYTPSQILSVSRYIHQNPMNAGLSNSIYDSKWTSLHDFIHENKESDLVDIDYILQIFSDDRKDAIKKFKKYMEIPHKSNWMDDEVKIKKSDEEVIQFLKRAGIHNVSDWQKLNRIQRNNLLKKLKETEGISVEQLSRITGLTKSMIYRA